MSELFMRYVFLSWIYYVPDWADGLWENGYAGVGRLETGVGEGGRDTPQKTLSVSKSPRQILRSGISPTECNICKDEGGQWDGWIDAAEVVQSSILKLVACYLLHLLYTDWLYAYGKQ